MVPPCIFCRGERGSPSSREHVVPESLGGSGWLITHDVCVTCNSDLGSQVDKIAEEEWACRLRLEAGLPARRRLPVEYEHPDLGTLVGLADPSGRTVEPIQPETPPGKYTVIGTTPAEVEAKREQVSQRVRKRRGEEIEWGPIKLGSQGQVVTASRWGFAAARGLGRRLTRLGAKIALGYIAKIAGTEVALHPDLDCVREWALQGTNLPGTDPDLCDLLVRPPIWLPRTRQLLGLGEGDQPDLDEYQTLRAEMEPLRHAPGSAEPPPSARTVLSPIGHTLGLLHSRKDTVFRIKLFHVFSIDLPLPPDLPLPWGRTDFREFAPRRRTGVRL